MKRLTLFCAAILAAMMSFATVTYELNGGVTNDYGFCTPDSMFSMFMKDAGVTNYNTLTYYKQQADPLGAPNICAALTNAAPALTMEKWAWLKTYIESVHAAQAADGASTLPADGTGAAWRYAVGAFFIDGQRTGWPKSANFATCGAGTPAAFMAVWQGAYANPTDPTETFTLNEPYKEEATFDGWYAAADFSGAKVLTVDASTTGTLYAKWIEYVPTIAEVVALADSTTTKAAGVINFVQKSTKNGAVTGSNIYIQDVSGAILVYVKGDVECVAGQKITINGMKVTYGGAPEIANATITATENASANTPLVFATLKDLTKEPLKYFGQLVSLQGMKIISYDSYNNPTITDYTDTVVCYKMVLDPAVYAVGSKVNLVAVAAYYNKFQLVGDVAGFELVTIGKKDPYVYPARGENGEYTLENKWLITTVEDNYAANKPGPTDCVRGMAAKDGKMYFINRSTASIVVVDAATADMLEPIKITGEHLFEAQGEDGEWANCVTLPYNDIKFDNAGNCLIGACLSGNQHFQIYKVDLTTGAATVVVDEAMNSNPDFLDGDKWSGRFDAFGVYGDVDGDAIIMAQDANSFNAYKWTIEGGVAGAAELIENTIDVAADQSYLISGGALSVSNFGTAPQIFPVDFNYFYVDGWSTLPMLFDMNGALAEDFISCPTGVAVANNEGDTCKMNQGHNGLAEFEVGGEYFLIMAATNTVGSPTSAFALYKFADAAKSFSGLTPMWYFPAEGMGALTNGCRTAVPSVEVKGNKATLYVYTNNNGYGVYEFTGKESTGVENVATEKVESIKVIENGQVIIIRNGVRYNVLGAVVK